MPKLTEEPLLYETDEPAPKYFKEQQSPQAPPVSSMDDFLTSIQKDVKAAALLAESLDMTVVRKFVDIIDKCDGTLITSGIGKRNVLSNILFRKELMARYQESWYSISFQDQASICDKIL